MLFRSFYLSIHLLHQRDLPVFLQLYSCLLYTSVGFKDIHTGDTLCDETAPIVLESMDFPEPVIGIDVYKRQRLDLDALSYELRHRAGNDASQQRKNEALKRLQVVESFRASRCLLYTSRCV